MSKPIDPIQANHHMKFKTKKRKIPTNSSKTPVFGEELALGKIHAFKKNPQAFWLKNSTKKGIDKLLTPDTKNV